MLHLYELGIGEDNTMKQRKQQRPEIIKGLFKEEVRVTFIFADAFAYVATYHYRSEAVLIRMLTGTKKYMRYFE
jgi:hypothetical protein